MSNLAEDFEEEMPDGLDQVDWMVVSEQQTNTLRKILREQLAGLGSSLGDHIAETGEINEFVSYDPK